MPRPRQHSRRRGDSMQSRREFGKGLVLASIPALALAKLNSTVKGVHLGVCTYSFRDFPRTPGTDNIDAIIDALKQVGASDIELFNANVEPAPAPMPRPAQPEGGAPQTPEARAAAMRARANG